jgi:adenylate kinase
MSKIVVLMGAPGAGKGTQARLLQERTGLPQISTGDMFRELAKADTPLAREVREVQAAGRLVSDDLVIRVVEERTNREDCRRGYVLDGFPRTTAQAAMLEKLAVGQGSKIQAVLVDTPYDVLEKRVTGRYSCPVCGEIYNVYFKPPRREGYCDLHPETKLVHRSDDTAEKIRVRLETYEEQTRPLLDYYERSRRLHRVDGTREVEEIYADIEKMVTGGQ